MIATICDCCGKECTPKSGLVNVKMNFLVVKTRHGNKSSEGEYDFHPECFRQCFNTFIETKSKCFTDLEEIEDDSY